MAFLDFVGSFRLGEISIIGGLLRFRIGTGRLGSGFPLHNGYIQIIGVLPYQHIPFIHLVTQLDIYCCNPARILWRQYNGSI